MHTIVCPLKNVGTPSISAQDENGGTIETINDEVLGTSNVMNAEICSEDNAISLEEAV